MTDTEIIHDILDHSIFLNLATVDAAGQPWNTPVAFSFDHDLNLYWRSGHQSQHSQNIAHNPKIFITIYNLSLGKKALYVQATAEVVETEAEIKHALSLDRHPEFAEEPAAYTDDNPRRYYKAVPLKLWTNQDSQQDGRFVDTRRELELESL